MFVYINVFSHNSCDTNHEEKIPQIRDNLREAIQFQGHSVHTFVSFFLILISREFTWKQKPWFLNYYYPPEVITSVYYIIINSTCHQLYIPKEEIMISCEDNEAGTDVILKERHPIILKVYSIMKNKGKEIRRYCHISK